MQGVDVDQTQVVQRVADSGLRGPSQHEPIPERSHMRHLVVPAIRANTAISAILAALVLSACGSDDPATPADGAVAPIPDSVEIMATLTCHDGTEARPPASLGVAHLERCIYRPSIQRLDVQIDDSVGGHMFVAQIASFNGVGTFVTSSGSTDTDSFVEMRADATTVNTAASSSPDCQAHACSFNVTKAGVVSAGAGGQGTLAFDLECPSLGGAAVYCLECAVSPTTFHIDVAACTRDD